MLRALLYLRLTSFKNWFLARGRRLRQPKYLLGAVVGCAYFYFFFFRPLGENANRRVPAAASEEALRAMEIANAALPADWLPATTALGALGLLTFITFMWVIPAQRAALGFSEAEIAFLFPAPISRRGLVHFRLLSSQFRSLIGAAVMMLFSNRWAFVGGNALTHAIGWWFIFSTLNLHFSGANFTLTRLSDIGVGAWRRRLLVFLGIAAVFGIAFARMSSATAMPALGAAIDLRPATEWIIALTSTAPLGWLLWPFKQVLGPFLAVDARHFLLALGPALAVVGLHYLWVVRTAIAFEDASVEYAQKRGARIAAWRSGHPQVTGPPKKGRTGPFRLPSVGRPEFAFLWKNLLSTWQYFTLRVLLICAAAITGAAAC
jgi:ABC-2 type transport system permease protein